MYYIVGEWRTNYFIFDDSDNSVELVTFEQFEKLKKSGVNISNEILIETNPIDINKFKMLYSFDKPSKVYRKVLLTYVAPCINYEGRLCYPRIELVFVVIPRSMFKSSAYYSYFRVCLKYGYPISGKKDDYIIILVLNTDAQQVSSGRIDVKNNGIKFLDTVDKPYYTYASGVDNGFVVPLRLFLYMMQLYGNRDLSGIFRAFNGLLSDNLVLPEVAVDNVNTKGGIYSYYNDVLYRYVNEPIRDVEWK